MGDKPISLIEHLEALRRVVMVSLVAVVACSLAAYFFYGLLLAVIARPLVQWHYHLIFIGVTEGFVTRLRLSFFCGALLSLPVIFWQVWKFLLPALKHNEKRLLVLLVPFSVFFFLLGVTFAFYVVLPLGLKTLLAMGGPGVAPLISVGNYISFVTKFLLSFGLVFETPVVVFSLARAGVISYAFLARNRKYAVLVSTVAAAALAPGPDVFSLLMLAIPTYLIFELSVLIARFVHPAPVDLSVRKGDSSFGSGLQE